MVKEGAVVIDVGINRVDGKLCGDVDFDNVAPKASFITPVPGGCGLTTVAMLMKNTITAAKKQHSI
jgi:methylenetetrahydrofolate dehydrogenase (NADP+)/methenyltetrahydrofolate cyclohydrolase